MASGVVHKMAEYCQEFNDSPFLMSRGFMPRMNFFGRRKGGNACRDKLPRTVVWLLDSFDADSRKLFLPPSIHGNNVRSFDKPSEWH